MGVMSEQRTALVTGGNRGLGLEVCRRLALLDLRVVLGARDPALGAAAASRLRDAGGDVRFEVLDVGDEASVRACARRLADERLSIDVLVNNAGVYPRTPVLELSADELDQTLRVNLHGALWAAQAFLPGMIERGFGRVVNVSSGYGSFAGGLAGGPPAYGISKAALNALTVVLASAVPSGCDVLVNAVSPGWVRTRMGGADAERSVEQGAQGIVELATLTAGGANGGFFRDGAPIPW
jgi:NAD(P)-dependent dehydrogenase (short-subunit alcohol dehydrogenase family)